MDSQFTTMASEGRGSRIGNLINKSISGEKYLLNIPEEYEDRKSYEDNEEIITLNLYCDFTQYALEDNKKPVVFEGQNSIIYKVNFKIQSSINLENLIIKGITHFNEYFEEFKIPLRLKEYNSSKIKGAYFLKPSKKNGLPKNDFPNFDLKMTLSNTNYKVFSLVFKKDELVILNGKSSVYKNKCRDCCIL